MFRTPVAILACLCVCAISAAQRNPFQPPTAKIHYAPDRTFDLKHVAVTLDIDYPNRVYSGVVKNTYAPLRSGLTSVMLHAWEGLTISSVTLDGATVNYRRDKDDLHVSCPPTVRGKASTIVIKYSSKDQKGGHFAEGGGWHWIEPNDSHPSHVGFWTQGETLTNRQWCPTWDYPNDFATSESVVTVDAGWSVIGNGSLVSDTVKSGRRTWHWKMSQPHATYLISLVGGPFDIGRDTWQGIDLWYVVPKGKGHLIPGSFDDTKDMLSFFSKVTGLKYPWPKYAQNAMYDFGGGMENVSATTLGEGALTDPRAGFMTMSGLNAHELAHQWFGDYVTCKDWSHIWLNESFATFFQALYFEHARGAVGYAESVEGNMQGYFNEARRYKRPLVTKMYANPDSVFDSHAYPKGASVLHTLRRMIGDQAFFVGIKAYLLKHANQPVVSDDLCQAMTDACGFSLEWFWDQWVYKPGHPVIEYEWSYNDTNEVVLKVRQMQGTEDGTPIYRIPTKVGFISGSKVTSQALTLSDAEQEFKFKTTQKPDAVILDPDHDFLREMKHSFAADEAESIARYAPNPIDRRAALNLMLADSPDATMISAALRLLESDRGQFPVFNSTSALAKAAAPATLLFFRSELTHPDFGRRTEAVRVLGQPGMPVSDRSAIRALVSDAQPYSVVLAALGVLDPKEDTQTFLKAAAMSSLREQIRARALGALTTVDKPEATAAVMNAAKSANPAVRVVGIRAMASLKLNGEIRGILRATLKLKEWDAVSAALGAIRTYSDKEMIGDVEALSKQKLPANMQQLVDRTLRDLKG
ncbi:MAG: hypothetical protein KF784_11080 [Fimbriimonadaceae bacterium]|nr:hypothetical protein [Fimbriimonadaceae bacterium]